MGSARTPGPEATGSAQLAGRRVLLVITGGIAAYKCLELIRRLREQGAAVRAILTAAASHFVTPLSVAALTEDRVYQDLFSLTDEAEVGHIRLSREADLVVVAPATANVLAKMAAGIADDLATTALLAADIPILVAPAMNVKMWQHPATQANLRTLRERGVRVVGPEAGDLACGETGAGRMAEPAELLAAIRTALGAAGPLRGRRALVTAGPTHEAIDPVRYLANRSSGKQGFAIAAALAAAGADTTLVSGPTHLPEPPGVRVVRVESAAEMLQACQAALPVDLAVCAAAVADWRVEQPEICKLKKVAAGPPTLHLVANPDILATLSRHPELRPHLVVGFAAETENLLRNARAKLAAKGCDWVVANDVGPASGTFGGDDSEVHLVTAAAVESWRRQPKTEVARLLVERLADTLAAPAG